MNITEQISKLVRSRQGNSRTQKSPRRNRLRRLLIEQMEDRRLLATIDLAALTASEGTTIFGADAFDYSGVSVSSAGDVNGDGFDDLLIGAHRADASGNAKSSAGDNYVIFGGASLPATIDLANLGSAGITIFGADTYDQSGISVSGVGDVNGDGFDDLLIGAYRARASGNAKSYAGDSYVIFGGSSLPAVIDLANLGSAGITIFGADAYDFSGRSVSGAGDVDGDGFDDLLIGAYGADASGNVKSGAGDSYLIFGGTSLPTTIDLANLGSAGITIFGADANDQSGVSVSGAGDVNGDGFDDLLIGARFADASGNAKEGAGDSYVIFGGASLPATIDLANLGSAGITIFGADASDTSGRSVSRAGDVNGDGFNDLLIGARGADGAGNAKIDAGDSYVIFGGDFTASITHQGTAASETLTGTVVADTMIGGLGNDNLVGNGGDDVLTGGQGDDILAVSDLSFKRIVGGTGNDMLRLDGSGLSLDLTALSDNRLVGIEQIDISGTGNNTLTLNQREVLNISDESNTLIVRRNLGDTVNMGAGWTRVSNETIGPDTFEVFSQGQAVLKIQTTVAPPIILDLAALTAAQGTTIFGADQEDLSGRSVSSAGDVNGDGFDDLLIGAIGADASGNARSGAGDSYVIFGGASLPATIDPANLGSAGITIFGTDSSDYSGISVSSAGDVNGDGFDDLIIGASGAGASGNAKPSAGESYLIFGGSSLPATIDLANLGSAGITIYGADADDRSGYSVSGAGDVNGDGFDDLLIGALRADASGNAKSQAGDSYVIFGGASLPATIDLANLGSAGVTIFGADIYDHSGISVSGAGDVNGDGFDDLLIGARFADASGNARSFAGDSYVIFGGAALPATIDLASLGSAGIKIFGAEFGDTSGGSVSGVGDVNGDGFDDLLIGAYSADASGNAKLYAGESYVIFGGSSLPATIDLANLGSAGISIFGADDSDYSGKSVSSAGDVNGDGFADLLIGASFADALGNAKTYAGDSYVIFGGDFTDSITHQGTPADETLTGSAAADVMIGGRGNDNLVGNGGADVLIGGQGDDILAVSDLAFKRIIGGTGSDTLRLDGSGLSLDLTELSDNRLLGIEQIDIRGTGNNTLTLNQRDVLNISDESNTLIVWRNLGDTVNMGTGWTQGSNETLGPDTFEVFSQGQAVLKIQTTVAPPLIIDLAALTASQGTTIFGADAGDYSGISVSSAGDVNGDGFDDLLIGAHGADAAGNTTTRAGESYVIFGGTSLPATIDLANLGSAGITIFGADAEDHSGLSVSRAGDVNGDGFDDLLIGASFAEASGNAKWYAGESYIIFGGSSLPATIDLANLSSAGITIFGADADDFSSRSVSGAGDVNGDGFDDVIIGAMGADASGNAKTSTGESYVIFGGASLAATIDLASLGSAGITILGADAYDESGVSVSSAGDVNGDGFDDLIIGAWAANASGNAKSQAGDSYVIFGGASLPTTIDLANLGSAGITILGADAYDRSGVSVSSTGDVNGDGFDDLLIGARGADASGNAKSYAGESYVIFGGASLPTTIDLANLGSAGITIFGADANDRSGISVSSAGDVNGDGFDDLLIGAYRASASGNAKSQAGESYVIFGGESLPTTIDLASLGSVGITIFGADILDRSGHSVSSAGDVNGDGFDDLLMGARRASASGNTKAFAGESYVIFGGDFTDSITHQGTAADETLTGTAAADVMIGGPGNDVLVGNGGADVLTGGQGDDILAVSDLTFKRIVGGTGNDTLRLDGSGLWLDLTSLPDNRIIGIEQIDLTGSGNNTLTLNLREVLNLSDESNTLIVRRNTGDVVDIGSGWTQGANEIDGVDTFNVYTQGAATLKVQSTLSASLDGVGNLTIADIDVSGKNNSLTVSVSGANLVITEANEQFIAAPAGGTLSNSNKTLTIPISSVTGSLTVNGHGGSDIITINASLATGLFINGGVGADTYVFNVGNLAGPVSVADSGSASDTDSLIVNGSAGNDTLTKTLSQVTVVGASASTVNYSGIEQFALDGKAGGDSYSVDFGGTALTQTTIFDSGPSSDLDTLTVNGTVSNDFLFKNAGFVQWKPLGATSFVQRVDFSNMDLIILRAGDGNDTIHDPGEATQIYGGRGDDTIIVDATTGSGVSASGEEGDDTYIIHLGSLAGPVSINDSEGSSTVQVVGTPGDDYLTLTSVGGSSQLATGTGETITFNVAGATATAVAIDGAGGSNIVTFQGDPPTVQVTTTHTAPIVTMVSAPLDPKPVSTAINASAAFVDMDLVDSHTAVWNWGDGTSSPGTVTNPSNSTPGLIAGNHAYSTAGVYSITLTVTDQYGASSQSVFQYVVIYDPSAGFVTGGGWINSPAGAYPANASLSGKATFGFNSKYKNGATVPTGNTEFKVADFNFKSISYEWLVISDAKASYRGVGTVNGTGSYGFELTVWDGNISGESGVDKFRVKIWNKDQGNVVVYDNMLGAAEGATPTTALGGGSIVIHNNGQPLLAAGGAALGTGSGLLTQEALNAAVDQAINYWVGAGIDASNISKLRRMHVQVAELPAAQLGIASDTDYVWIDRDAAGYGWQLELSDVGNSLLADGIDLISVVAHELGHKLGLEHSRTDGDLMAPGLHAGVRTLVSASLLTAFPIANTVYPASLDSDVAIASIREHLSSRLEDAEATQAHDQFFGSLADQSLRHEVPNPRKLFKSPTEAKQRLELEEEPFLLSDNLLMQCTKP